MDARNAQIYNWCQTGEHVIRTDYDKVHSDRSETKRSNLDQPSSDASNDDASSSTSSALPENLVGAENDPLIPNSSEINRVFQEGLQTWNQFVELAKSLPENSFPADLGDPSIMLKDVPALPSTLPKNGVLVGQPLWHIPSAEYRGDNDARSEDFDLEHIYGLRKQYSLSFYSPIECRSSSQHDFSHYGMSLHPDGRASAAPSGLLPLTLCWSYIFSARFWELQGKTILYTSHTLQPNMTTLGDGDVSLHFDASAPHDLVKWLCAVLAPRLGWSVKEGGCAPWAAFCSGDVRFVISTDKPLNFTSHDRPPSSARATELLIEFCRLHGLGPSNRIGRESEILSPPTAAFLAALALPFYHRVKLQPQFPVPKLCRRNIDITLLEPIRQYVADLRYYMTLSMHPRSLGSVIWSIFWQPEVECNLVSPWLKSIISVLRPIIDAGNLPMMAKTFAFRRPRVALWWLGIFLLGDTSILKLIVRYLETLNERWGYGSMAPPDTAVSVWTGSPQSFLNDETPHVYTCLKDAVPVADLLRYRYNFRLQDESSLLLSWRPFGFISKEAVEPDLWPWLECGHGRKYMHWVWWMKKEHGSVPDVQPGFRKDTGRFIASVPDHLEVIRTSQYAACDEDIKLEPSLESTLRMIHYCVYDSNGDQDREISSVPGALMHPWLKGWRGLE